MNNLQKLQELQYWLKDNVDQGQTALVHIGQDGTNLTQSDCAQAIAETLGTGDGLKLYAETLLNMAQDMGNLPHPVDTDKALVLIQLSRVISYTTALMYEIDPEISENLGQSITSVTDMFNDFSNAQSIQINTLVKLKASVKNSHRCPEGREDNSTAEVQSVLSGGRLHLSRDLHGCRWWNINDVEPA